jgi:uncharacterized phage protein (TIGR01671 family)
MTYSDKLKSPVAKEKEMREIKFRAWDVFNQEMFPKKINDDLLAAFFREVNIRRNGGNTVHLMQYTGLKDKNGKEIYEGDIFEWDGSHETGIFVVSFESGSFGAGQPFELSWEIDHNNMQVNNGKVIGNIYENPNLLKVE